MIIKFIYIWVLETMTTISQRELARAFGQHFSVYKDVQTQNSSHYLLLFYAVECGLKAVLMRRRNAQDTDQLGAEYNFGHDLNLALKELRVNHFQIPSTQIVNRAGRVVEPRRINEAWRYGARLNNEVAIVSILEEIVLWIKSEMDEPR